MSAIAIAAFVFVLPMIVWGYAPTHDFNFHVGNWMEVARQWRQGIVLPRWAAHANYGFGEPRFIFYPPLSNFVGAAISLFTPWRAVPGTFVFLSLVLAGTCMYLLARERLSSRYALLAALAYMLNPYEVMLVYKRMAAAELLACALFPLVLLYALRVTEGRPRSILPLAAAYGAVWLTNAPSAVMVSYSIFLVFAALAVSRRSVRPLLSGGAALVLGIAFAAFYIVPAAWEQRWVDISLALTLPHNRPENNFLRLFPPRLPGGIASIITVGVINLVLAAVVCWIAFRRRRPLAVDWWLWVAVTGFAAIFTLPFSIWLWQLLPKMIFVQLPWRWLFVVNTACALLFAAVMKTFSRRGRLIAAAVPVLIFFVLIGAYATKGKTGKVSELELQMRSEGGVWPEAQYLPRGGAQGPRQSNALLAADSSAAKVQVLKSNSEHFVLAANSSIQSKLLLNVAWYPVWAATVNGAAAEVRSNHGLIEVSVPPGSSIVELTFLRTADRTLGGVVSLLAIGVAGIVWCTLRLRQRRSPQPTGRYLEQQA